jgi:hypothetical protein
LPNCRWPYRLLEEMVREYPMVSERDPDTVASMPKVPSALATIAEYDTDTDIDTVMLALCVLSLLAETVPPGPFFQCTPLGMWMLVFE